MRLYFDTIDKHVISAEFDDKRDIFIKCIGYQSAISLYYTYVDVLAFDKCIIRLRDENMRIHNLRYLIVLKSKIAAEMKKLEEPISENSNISNSNNTPLWMHN